MHASMDAFGCFFCLEYCKKRKGKFLQKFIQKKKYLDLFDQFVSMAEGEIDII